MVGLLSYFLWIFWRMRSKAFGNLEKKREKKEKSYTIISTILW